MGGDASKIIGKDILLRNDHGKHFQYTGSVFYHSIHTGSWEQWRLEVATPPAVEGAPETKDKDKDIWVYIHNVAHDIRVSAVSDKRKLAAVKKRGHAEQWKMVLGATGTVWYFQSIYGQWLNMGADGTAYQSPNKGGSEQFTVVAAPAKQEAKR